MYHWFRGKRWSVKDSYNLPSSLLGLCDYEKSTIQAPIYDGSEKGLDTVIHECTHACFPDLNEEAVNESSTNIARLLIKLGWELNQKKGRK